MVIQSNKDENEMNRKIEEKPLVKENKVYKNHFFFLLQGNVKTSVK